MNRTQKLLDNPRSRRGSELRHEFWNQMVRAAEELGEVEDYFDACDYMNVEGQLQDGAFTFKLTDE